MDHTKTLTPKQRYDRKRYQKLKAERESNAPPDPIKTLKATERAYLAGLVDADGSIFVTAVGPQRHRTVYPTVVIAITYRPALEWIRDRLKTGTLKKHNQTNMRKFPHLKQQYRVQFFGKRAKLLCKVMLPYLKIKHEQAKLVMTFPTDARIAPGIKIERTTINEVRYRLRDQINALNH